MRGCRGQRWRGRRPKGRAWRPKGEGTEGKIKSRRLLKCMYRLICTQSKRRSPAVKSSQRLSYALVNSSANGHTNAPQTTHFKELKRALPSNLPMQMATTSCAGLRTATATYGTWTEALPCSCQTTSPCRASLYCALHGTRSSTWQVSTLLSICRILSAQECQVLSNDSASVSAA